eukprot:422444_1
MSSTKDKKRKLSKKIKDKTRPPAKKHKISEDTAKLKKNTIKACSNTKISQNFTRFKKLIRKCQPTSQKLSKAQKRKQRLLSRQSMQLIKHQHPKQYQQLQNINFLNAQRRYKEKKDIVYNSTNKNNKKIKKYKNNVKHKNKSTKKSEEHLIVKKKK